MNKPYWKTKLYHIWTGIKTRCYNPKEPIYKNYGGRGIKCLWNSFEEFKKDMDSSFQRHLKKYGGKYTQINRIDNDGHYCKENCRWVTPKENAQNRRSRVEITYKGKTKSIFEWADYLKFPRVALWLRIFRYHWPIEKAFTKSLRKRHTS